MRVTSQHVVGALAGAALAAVLAPAGVAVASGTPTTIVDPLLPSRKARVGSAGALQVETRPGVTSGAFNVDTSWSSADPTYWRVLATATGPTRITLSEITLKLDASGAPATADVPVRLASYTQFYGDDPACGPGTVGYARTVLRTLHVKSGDPMVQVLFNGPPLIVPPAADGVRTCLVWEFVVRPPDDTRFYLGATGFRYS